RANEQGNAAPAGVDRALSDPGKPLDPELRQDMEQRFGYDFSRVRVHSDAAAQQSARELNANAYTVGHDVVFWAGRFPAGTHENRRLLAHELAHVVQQSGAGGFGVDQNNMPLNSRLQRKATVKLEGYGTNWVGHDDSDVTFTPVGTFEASGDPRVFI